MLLRRRMLKGLKSGNSKNLKASEEQRSPFAYTPVEEQAHAPRAEGEPARLLPESRPHEFRGLHPRGMIRFALRPGLQWEDRHSIMYYFHSRSRLKSIKCQICHSDSLQFPIFHRHGHVEAEHGAEAEDGGAEADRAQVNEPAAVGLFWE